MLHASDRDDHDKAACQSKSVDFRVPFVFFALIQKHQPCQYTNGYRDTTMASLASGKLRARSFLSGIEVSGVDAYVIPRTVNETNSIRLINLRLYQVV